ncbi:nuclear transport factor 2 family protein [Mucilaginibacter sp.]|uniref:nuclear transport factor 2 family protein n=1 Tax=Mucilaginibacter sp. TaxID=1882438 RepID=UPI0025E6405F|nr:nuclear transport factor 2 family protein [Mucilaginibacter sp.]
MINSVKPQLVNAQSKKSVDEVAVVVESLRKAMVDADSLALNRLTADGLSYGHSSGVLQSKAEFIHSIASGASDFVTIDLSEQKITLSGNTAIVRHVLSATTNDAGKGPGKVKIGILLVWIKNKSGWQLLARQAVKLP